jgi:hypothetical protein
VVVFARVPKLTVCVCLLVVNAAREATMGNSVWVAARSSRRLVERSPRHQWVAIKVVVGGAVGESGQGREAVARGCEDSRVRGTRLHARKTRAALAAASNDRKR